MAKHIVIVGKGLAGTMAALSAAKHGCEVTVVARSLGRTALGSGLLPLADPTRLNSIQSPLPLKKAVATLIETFPHHPFGRIDGAADILETAVELFIQHSGNLYPDTLDGDAIPPRYPNEWGTVSRAFFAPNNAGALTNPIAGERCIQLVSLSGYPRFRTRFLADALSKYHLPSGQTARVEVLAVDLAPDGGIFQSPAQLAGWLDDDENLTKLAQAIKAANPASDSSLFLPPVLGIRRHNGAAKLSEMTGFPAYELAATYFSVPGIRMANQLTRALAKENIKLISAVATGLSINGRKISGIKIQSQSNEKEVLEADAVVFATGKFLGGGIHYHDKNFREPIADLPLFLGGREIQEQFIGHISDQDFLAPQKFSRLGVRIDKSCRPIYANDDPVFENLFTAGQILGGCDPTSDSAGEGVDLATGYVAGLAASEVRA